MEPRSEDLRQGYLSSERLLLRGAGPEDAETCAPWFNDPEVIRYLNTGSRPNLVETSREFLAQAARSSTDVVFAIIERESGRHIGNTALHRIDSVRRSAVFGIVIGVQDCWRRGYGTEATRMVVEYAFRRLNLHRVELEVAVAHAVARRAYERVGFQVEGTRRDAMFVEGSYADALVMAVLRPEWEARSKEAAGEEWIEPALASNRAEPAPRVEPAPRAEPARKTERAVKS
jgi:RimJ/RimL family protein N-acetyltransferase